MATIRIDLSGLRVAVDVQHLFRVGDHAHDRGAEFVTDTGGVVTEGDCALHYAQVLVGVLRQAGATVWTNEPGSHLLVGSYALRQRAAALLDADVYLACHVNAGGGSYATAEYMAGRVGSDLARAITDELAASVPGIRSRKVVPLSPGQRGAVCIEGFRRGPAVLVEPFFGDHPGHRQLLTLPGLVLVGEAVARGLITWWCRYPSLRRVQPAA